MLKIVSNTTPILSLLKIGKLHILKDLYNFIYIPTEVYNEIEAGKNKEFYTDLSKIEWIRIQNIKNSTASSYFLDLDKGEAEAIVLASEINANLILLDETLGRFHAQHIGLKISGTIGVLIKAKNLGYISELKPLLFELREKGIWLGNNFIQEILLLTNEK